MTENSEGLVEFRGTQIPQFEADILQEIEEQTGRKRFYKVDKIDRYIKKISQTRMRFTVSNNRVTGVGLRGFWKDFRLPESIGQLSSLKTLECETLLSTLPESIGDLKSLETLHLYDNLLSNGLPESIGNLKSLKKLSLNKNQLSTLPESIGNLNSLKKLFLGNNDLRTLPESIGNLKNLEVLELTSNGLTTLPESIGQLKSLSSLWLQYNILSTLPESIGNLTSLEYLDLRYNSLTTLPESIGDLSSLETLWLKDNDQRNLPESVEKEFKKWKKQGVESDAWSSCFIATAAYGSALVSELDHLRSWRDDFLNASKTGRILVHSYYLTSPPFAKFISKREALRRVIRHFLEPVVNILKKRGY